VAFLSLPFLFITTVIDSPPPLWLKDISHPRQEESSAPCFATLPVSAHHPLDIKRATCFLSNTKTKPFSHLFVIAFQK
jgi:hypothetical protein